MDSCSEKCNETGKKFQPTEGIIQFFHVIIISLLSLLLPVSFLLVARLTTAHYLISVAVFQETEPSSILASFFLSSNGRYLPYVVVGVITCASFINIVNGKLVHMRLPIDNVSSKRPYLNYGSCWIFLCIFQVLVCFGIEGSIASGIDASGFGREKDWLRRVALFLGMHETMRFCAEIVVKPIVDDTLFGHVREERWVEKVVLAFSFGMFWWWRLRDEVEALVVLVELKRMLEVGIGVADFFGWLLYYLVVIIGVVRMGKSLLWVGVVLLCHRRLEENNGSISSADQKPSIAMFFLLPIMVPSLNEISHHENVEDDGMCIISKRIAKSRGQENTSLCENTANFSTLTDFTKSAIAEPSTVGSS